MVVDKRVIPLFLELEAGNWEVIPAILDAMEESGLELNREAAAVVLRNFFGACTAEQRADIKKAWRKQLGLEE